jgi:hypothetical protein
VGTEGRGVEADAGSVSLDEVADRLGAEALVADLAAFPDRTENRPLGDPGCVQPCPQRFDRTAGAAPNDRDRDALSFLVRFAPADRDPEAVLGFLKVGDVKRDEGGAVPPLLHSRLVRRTHRIEHTAPAHKRKNGARFLTSFKCTPSALLWIATTIQPASIVDGAPGRTKFFERRFASQRWSFLYRLGSTIRASWRG